MTEAETIVSAQPHGVTALRWTSRRTLATAQYVGMLAAADVRLEILPKIKGLEEGATRGVLVRMIAASLDIPLHVSDITGHETQNNDFLEMLVGLFVVRLEYQMRQGLSRCYERRQEDLSRLRGKLDLIRQLSTHAANPQRLACHYDELNTNTALNRRLFCALRSLHRLVKNEITRRSIAKLLLQFEGVRLLTGPESLKERILLSRPDQRWQQVETLASLFLSGLQQTTQSGGRVGFALLFDMNLLFEKYVASLIKQYCRNAAFTCRVQGPEESLVVNAYGRTLFRAKPDLHVSCAGRVIVLDTKWKALKDDVPSLDISTSDIYQIHAYSTIYAADSVVLIYPSQPSKLDALVLHEWALGSTKIPLRIVSIDVARPDDINRVLADLFA